MATRMQQRRGTAAQWTSANPILAAGEIGFESDTNQFKIGDGIDHWDDLSYFKNLEDLGGSLDDYILLTQKGAISGVAELDADSNVMTKTGVVFEGATENGFETLVSVADPTEDRFIVLPNNSGVVVLADNSGNLTIPGNLTVSGTTTIIDSSIINVQNNIKFEGTTSNDFETSLTAEDPTAGRIITLPDASGTVVLDGNSQTLSGKSINLNSNTLTGTIALFNTALSDANFATLEGAETFTNKTLTSPKINEDIAVTATATEINTLDGITSSTAELNILDGVTSTATELNILTGATLSTAELNVLDGVTATSSEINALSGITATSAELNILDGALLTTSELNILSGITATSSEINSLSGLTASSSELNILDGATLSVTELNYVDGVTSSIQTQLDDKAPLNSPTFTGTVTLPANTISQTHLSDDSVGTNEIGGLAVTNEKLAGSIGWDKLAISSTVSSTEAGYLGGVTSAIQTQLDNKQDVVTGVSTTEIGYLDGVTSSIQNQLDNKQAVVANVSDTEIGYLDGVTSSIQTQIDGKASTSHTHAISDVTSLQTSLDAKAALSGAIFTGDVTVETNLTVDGNLTVTGTTTTVDTQDLVVTDPMIYMGEGNSANLVDLGIVSSFNDGTYQHSGIVRDASAGTWKFFKGVTDEPTTTVNFSQGSLDDLAVNNLTAAGIVFTDGTQTKQGVQSLTPIISKTDSYTLSELTERDSLIEVAKSTATTITIPTDATLNFPIGTSLDILQTSTGQVTIAGAVGVTVNATPGLKLRTTWSSATLFKRAANTWVVYGDLTA